MPLIALCGPKGSGKTTLAKQLPYQRTAFAKPIYLMLEALLVYRGASPEEIEYLFTDGKEKETRYLNYRTVRYALQTLGTEWGRELIDKDLWIGVWEDYYISKGKPPSVIEDMRFKNESEMVAFYKGTRVRIERPGIEPDTAHISETEQRGMEVELTIVNDGASEDMVRELNHFLQKRIKGENST